MAMTSSTRESGWLMLGESGVIVGKMTASTTVRTARTSAARSSPSSRAKVSRARAIRRVMRAMGESIARAHRAVMARLKGAQRKEVLA